MEQCGMHAAIPHCYVCETPSNVSASNTCTTSEREISWIQDIYLFPKSPGIERVRGSYIHSLSHSLTHSLTLSLSFSLSHPFTHSLSLSLSLSHSLTHSLRPRPHTELLLFLLFLLFRHGVFVGLCPSCPAGNSGRGQHLPGGRELHNLGRTIILTHPDQYLAHPLVAVDSKSS